jgi:hypothetical protein
MVIVAQPCPHIAAIKWLAFLFGVLEIPVSNRDPETVYMDFCVSWFY